MTNHRRLFPLGLVLTSGLACASSGSRFGPRRVDPVDAGYALTVTSITPQPGTELRPGALVHFVITASYRLEQTDSGRIVLVPQDDRGRPLGPNGPQASVAVARGSGVVTLGDSVIVPSGLRELQLFVLLAPAGATHVHGETVVQFPVRTPP